MFCPQATSTKYSVPAFSFMSTRTVHKPEALQWLAVVDAPASSLPGSPLAVEQLVRVAKEPPAEGATLDKQEVLNTWGGRGGMKTLQDKQVRVYGDTA